MTSDTTAASVAEENELIAQADDIIKSKASPAARLWRDHNFNLFWVGQTFDAFGDAASLIMIPLLVFEATGSVVQMGLVMAAIGVGNLISSIVSGIIVDSVDRRKVLVLCDIGRTLFYLILPAYWWLIGPSMWPIYVIALTTAYLSTFFVIAYVSVIPNIVDQDQIADSNGRLQATVAAASVAGPMLAGLASQRFGTGPAILLIAAAYFISACLIFFVKLRKGPSAPAAQATSEGSSRFDSLLAGARFLLRHPALKSVTLLIAAIFFITGATINLFIYRLKHDLNQSDNTVGLVFGLASVGAILAGALTPMLYRKKGFGFSFIGSFFIIGIAVAMAGLVHNLTIIAAMAVLYSFGISVRGISSMTLRQQVTPDHLLGRVSSAFWILLTVLGPLGTAAASVLADVVGAPISLIICGVLCIAVAVVGLFTPASVRRPEEVYPLAMVEAGGQAPGQ